MSDSKKKILEMLAKGKINADDAYRLLSAVDESERDDEAPARAEPVVRGKGKYLRVTITPGENQENPEQGDRVNVRVPLSLIRAGIKLTSLIPNEARDKVNDSLKEKGIDFDVNNVKAEDIEELIEALGDMEVDIDGRHNEKIKVFVE